MKRDANIVLIGMPGVGKSTVGVLLAKATARRFVDTDVYIQAAVGRTLQEILDAQGREAFCRHHAQGVAFKLHPLRSAASREALAQQHTELSALAGQLWVWLENLRLGTAFADPGEYALSTPDKCPETPALRNLLLNARTLGLASALQPRGFRYPRQRLLHSLCLLLWGPHVLSNASLLRTVQQELNTCAADFPGLVRAYEQLWHRFN